MCHLDVENPILCLQTVTRFMIDHNTTVSRSSQNWSVLSQASYGQLLFGKFYLVKEKTQLTLESAPPT
jgi:hypothetical protein